MKFGAFVVSAFFIMPVFAEENFDQTPQALEPPSFSSISNNSTLFGISSVGTGGLITLYIASRARSGHLGIYFDIGSTPRGIPSNQIYKFSKYTAEQVFQDRKTNRVETYVQMNIGPTIKVNENVTAFGAIGYVSKTEYQGYYDEFGILGDRGRYYLEDKSETGANCSVGLMLLPLPEKNSFHIHVALNSYFRSTTIGLGLGF